MRLLKPAEFRRVYDEGATFACPLFKAFWRSNGEARVARFGFTCPRALGKAVARNRMKRRLRECVRLRRERFPEGLEIVFNPRRAMLDAEWGEVERQVERFLSKIGGAPAEL
ncbi:MAG: ribonuclease P protein component [Bryobacter sp.]|nr:ribonuclease P protein component [Bryobacter sp.]